MTSTQLHAGYTAPANQANKVTTPLEKITAMLKGCGIKILPVFGYPRMDIAKGEDGKDVDLYRAVARGSGEQITAQFNAAFPQREGLLEIQSSSAKSGTTWLIFHCPAPQ